MLSAHKIAETKITPVRVGKEVVSFVEPKQEHRGFFGSIRSERAVESAYFAQLLQQLLQSAPEIYPQLNKPACEASSQAGLLVEMRES